MKSHRQRRAELFESDLAAARAAEPSYDVTRGAARLSASLVAVGAAGGVASASAASAAKSGVTHGLVGKTLAMLALSGAAVTVDALAPVSPTALETLAPPPERIVELAPAPTEPRQMKRETAPASALPPVTQSARPLAPAGKKRGSDRFGRELADVASARALLAADPSAALSAAEKPSGSQALAEEREIIAIRALISLGRVAEAKTRARDFLARRPESPFAPSARRLLSE